MARTLFQQGYPLPDFVDRDPEKITQELIEQTEALLGIKLYPAQMTRLLLNLQAYREKAVRDAIQRASLMNLVSFAQGVHLDYLGELVGCFRLGESPSRCTLRFTLSAVPERSITITQGTRVGVTRAAGQILWGTIQSVVVRGSQEGGPLNVDGDGKPYVDVVGESLARGVVTNGFEPGEISTLIDDPFPYFESVVNLDQTRQGAATEDDERYRRRIIIAPEGFVGGSIEGYEYLALSVSPFITDATVYRVEPGHVRVSVLTQDGVPDDSLLMKVSSALKPDNRRPLTDWVEVQAPERVDVPLNVTLTPYEGYNVSIIEDRVRKAIESFIDERLPKLGIDVVPSQLVTQIGIINGVYRVEADTPTYAVIEPWQWANFYLNSLTINPAEPG